MSVLVGLCTADNVMGVLALAVILDDYIPDDDLASRLESLDLKELRAYAERMKVPRAAVDAARDAYGNEADGPDRRSAELIALIEAKAQERTAQAAAAAATGFVGGDGEVSEHMLDLFRRKSPQGLIFTVYFGILFLVLETLCFCGWCR